jgi:hypothetical protein
MSKRENNNNNNNNFKKLKIMSDTDDQNTKDVLASKGTQVVYLNPKLQ